jgi:hypothetical protein
MNNSTKIISITILALALFCFSESSLAISLVKFNSSTKVDLDSPLEAVLIVGNTEESTGLSIKKMNQVALIFENQGIKVTKFYNRNTNWEAIKTAAKTASFFVYSGHGSTMGVNGKTGGLCLNKMISTEQILKELQLKKNAIVLFKSVCGGAGSSAVDSKDIGIEEAATRVTDYAQPFFTIGAACYYADNYDNGIDLFLKEFLSGKSVGECYEITTKEAMVFHEIANPFILDANKQIAISSDKQEGTTTQYIFENGKTTCKKIPSFKNYDIAFVGNPNFSIIDLNTTN